MSRVSVIIRAYNASKYIKDAVRSVVNQTCDCPIELLILYDNGSVDNTREILNKLNSEINKQNIRLVVHEHSHVTPFRALQLGLKIASGDFIAFLDYDNMYELNYFSVVLREVKESNSSFIFTKALLIDANGHLLGRALLEIPQNPYDILRLLKWNYIDLNTILIRKDCLKDIIHIINNLTHRFYDFVVKDWLLSLLAFKECIPKHISNTYVLYRIHGENMNYNLFPSVDSQLFRIENEIKTLIAFYNLEKNKLSKREIKTLKYSLIRRYIAYIRTINSHIGISPIDIISVLSKRFIENLNKFK